MGQDSSQWVCVMQIGVSNLPSELIVPVIGEAFAKVIPKNHLLVLECLGKAMATSERPIGDQMVLRCTNYTQGVLKIVKEGNTYVVYVKST